MDFSKITHKYVSGPAEKLPQNRTTYSVPINKDLAKRENKLDVPFPVTNGMQLSILPGEMVLALENDCEDFFSNTMDKGVFSSLNGYGEKIYLENKKDFDKTIKKLLETLRPIGVSVTEKKYEKDIRNQTYGGSDKLSVSPTGTFTTLASTKIRAGDLLKFVPNISNKNDMTSLFVPTGFPINKVILVPTPYQGLDYLPESVLVEVKKRTFSKIDNNTFSKQNEEYYYYTKEKKKNRSELNWDHFYESFSRGLDMFFLIRFSQMIRSGLLIERIVGLFDELEPDDPNLSKLENREKGTEALKKKIINELPFFARMLGVLDVPLELNSEPSMEEKLKFHKYKKEAMESFFYDGEKLNLAISNQFIPGKNERENNIAFDKELRNIKINWPNSNYKEKEPIKRLVQIQLNSWRNLITSLEDAFAYEKKFVRGKACNSANQGDPLHYILIP